MLIQNNKTFEQYYEEFKPAINRMLYRFKDLKTSREDLQQEAAILLWKLTDKLNTMENPAPYFVSALRNLFIQILVDEHKQGLWSTDSIYKQHDGKEFNLLDISNYTTAFNYNFHDQWLENYYQKRREYYKEYYSRPEVKERMKAYHQSPEFKEKNRKNSNAYYHSHEEYRENQKKAARERYHQNKNNEEYMEKCREKASKYYYEHKDDPEFKEKQRLAKRNRYLNNPEYKEKVKARKKRYFKTEKGKEAKYRHNRKYQINQKIKKNYKEAATMTLAELKNNYEKIEDEILELMVDLDLLRAIEEPDNKIKRKIFSKEYELESLQYIKEDIKNEIERNLQ